MWFAIPLRAKHLSQPEHRGGKERGIELFKATLGYIEPEFLIIYGKKAGDTFKTKIKPEVLESINDENNEITIETISLNKSLLAKDLEGTFQTKVFFIRSIALPEWNKWKFQAPKTFKKIKSILEA